VETEVFLRLRVGEGGGLLANLAGECGEGGVEGGIVVAVQLGEGIGHGSAIG
jgi:hypothetical protein